MTPLEVFLAKGGKVQAIPAGVRSLSAREIYLRQRGESAEEVITRKFGNSIDDRQYCAAVEREKIERGY